MIGDNNVVSVVGEPHGESAVSQNTVSVYSIESGRAHGEKNDAMQVG
jgi:hypothetical protein